VEIKIGHFIYICKFIDVRDNLEILLIVSRQEKLVIGKDVLDFILFFNFKY
jgi:hypothetical protein